MRTKKSFLVIILLFIAAGCAIMIMMPDIVESFDVDVVAAAAANESSPYKYQLSLCSIIKNERYLEEFIVYHSCVGVEHFYLYDNGSTPSLQDRLMSRPFFRERCTIVDFPGFEKQMPAYMHCIDTYARNESKWLIIIDGDEFILPKKHNTILEFLNSLADDVQAVGINWMMFGSSFYENVPDGLLIDRYRYCAGVQNQHVKTICKPNYAVRISDPHSVIMQDPSKYVNANGHPMTPPFNSSENTIDTIQINHYHERSIEEQQIKKSRGSADGPNGKYGYQPSLHKENNDAFDSTLPDKYLTEVTTILQSIA